MPFLVHVVCAWLAGLFAATAWSPRTTFSPLACWSLAGIVLIVIEVVPALHRWRLAMVWCVIGSAGLVVGREHAEHTAACLRAFAQPTTPLEIALDSRAFTGAFVRGEARSSAGPNALMCALPVTLKVTGGDAPPGNIASFGGLRTVGERGLHLEGTLRTGVHGEVLREWRGLAGESIDSLFGPRAPLARALLIADQDGIDPSIRDRFADAGLIHILSISGLHVALIAGALVVVASALRIPNEPASILALVLVVLYVLVLGAPPPAVRSAVMLATGTIIARVQRPVHPWTALALGAVIPTFRPDVVLDLGWQLSVSGMASLVAARAAMRRVRNSAPGLPLPHVSRATRQWHRAKRAAVRWLQRQDGWRWTLVRELYTGVVASAVTAPIVAWYFGRISLVAPIANIFAGPVIAFLQPALFLALVLARWHAVAQLAADACTLPLALLDLIATRAAATPHAVVHVAPTLFTAVCLGVATAAFVRASAARWPARIVLVGALALCVAVWSPFLARGGGQLELHMIDVGQGDAIALRTPHGHWILIDAGRSWTGGDAGRRTVVPYVRRLGGDVDAFFLSHPHDDHVGGARSVLLALQPAQWWEPAYAGTSPTYRAALLEIQAEHIPWHRAHPGDSVRIDGVLIRTLAPDSAWTSVQTDPNLASVVVTVEYGKAHWLFTGDAEIEEEQWLIARWGGVLSASVLKAGHHGSKTSSSAPFLDLVNPALALVSVGAGNTYGHPSPSTLVEFARRGVRVLRTDLEGSIVVRTDGVTQEVETRSGRWNVPIR